MPDEFTHGTDWECSSGPIVPRRFALADLWPVGAGSEAAGGDKDVLADGLHPVVAIGSKANRPNNLTGVVTKYTDAYNVELNLADKVCVKQYVANNTTYSGTSPAGFDTSMAVGDPVYVDDSDALGAGVTLSRSPLNHLLAPNPLAGYLWYCQDDYVDTGVGGLHATAGMPVAFTGFDQDTVYCVLLVNDSGQTDHLDGR